MKRIPQNIAVQTLSYILRPNQLIRIVDFPNLYDCSENINGEVVFDDEVSCLNSWKYGKILSSKIHEILPRHNVHGTNYIVVKICTSVDEF